MSAFHSASGAPIIDGPGLVDRVRDDFGISLISISQVLGGQDSAAIVCRATTGDGAVVAVKVSRNARVDGLRVTAALAAHGWPGIPAPLLAADSQPYSPFDGGVLSVTPWINGRSAYGAGLSTDHWRDFGTLLSRVHSMPTSPAVRDQLPVEGYRSSAVESARAIDTSIRSGRAWPLQSGRASAGSTAKALIDEWRAASDSIAMILEHIDELGAELRSAPSALVVSHGDAHLGNLLVDDEGEIWLLDWDEIVLAPPERDLMFIIGGVLSEAPVTGQQQGWFFEGYGPARIDPRLLAYYRCSWAVADLADFAGRILEQPASAESDQALRFIRGILSATGIVALAKRSLEHAEVCARRSAGN